MWVCVISGSWWWTGRPDMLWFMGSQRVRYDWTTELRDFQKLHHHALFDLYGRLWKCHGACGCVIQFANVLQWVSLVAQLVKNWLAMWQTWVRSLGWKDPVEEGMANHSSFLAWRIPMDWGAWWATCPWDHKELNTAEWLSMHVLQWVYWGSESSGLRLSAILGLFGFNQFMLCPRALSFF